MTIGCTDGAVTIEITDDGAGEPGERDPAGGHGLAGMRERVAILAVNCAPGRGPAAGSPSAPGCRWGTEHRSVPPCRETTACCWVTGSPAGNRAP